MVLNNKIRLSAGSALFVILVLCFSCEKTFPGLILCADCYSSEPVITSIELKLSEAYHKSIRIEVYEGNLEDSILYSTFETSSARSNVSVILNKKYTLVATYYIPNDYYKVVNSVTPHTVYDETQCEKACYYIREKVVDLRLKKTI